MPVNDVIDRIRNRPDILLGLLGGLSGRLTATDGAFHSFVSDSVLVRLGAKLLTLASRLTGRRFLMSVIARRTSWLDLNRVRVDAGARAISFGDTSTMLQACGAARHHSVFRNSTRSAFWRVERCSENSWS